MTQRPLLLLLKDYLEQDPFSDSSNNVFPAFPVKQEYSSPTVHYFREAELSVGARLVRSRSKSALNSTLSVIVNAVKNFPLSSKNIAKKFGRSFWSKKQKGGGSCKVVAGKDVPGLDSSEGRTLFVSSSSSCCSEGEEGSESFLSSSASGGLESFGDGMKRGSPEEKSKNHRRESTEEGIENQEIERCCSEEEEKQLSPISIMDFPNEVEAEDEIAPLCFEQSLANIERTTHRLLQKIGRFESLAELSSLDLEIHLSPDDEEDDSLEVTRPSEEIAAWEYHVDPSLEKLLQDFFMENGSVGDVQWLIITAGDWINGTCFLKEEEHGKDQLKEMERNGRWRLFADGRDDVVAEVEVGVLEPLIQELLIDLGIE